MKNKIIKFLILFISFNNCLLAEIKNLSSKQIEEIDRQFHDLFSRCKSGNAEASRRAAARTYEFFIKNSQYIKLKDLEIYFIKTHLRIPLSVGLNHQHTQTWMNVDPGNINFRRLILIIGQHIGEEKLKKI